MCICTCVCVYDTNMNIYPVTLFNTLLDLFYYFQMYLILEALTACKEYDVDPVIETYGKGKTYREIYVYINMYNL
jgi:hypothetical protein